MTNLTVLVPERPPDAPESPHEERAVETADARWRAWQARGRARDIRMQRRMTVMTIVVAAMLGAALLWALLPG